MSRKLKKGYFVQGEFVAEGSERDLELKAELKGAPSCKSWALNCWTCAPICCSV